MGTAVSISLVAVGPVVGAVESESAVFRIGVAGPAESSLGGVVGAGGHSLYGSHSICNLKLIYYNLLKSVQIITENNNNE